VPLSRVGERKVAARDNSGDPNLSGVIVNFNSGRREDTRRRGKVSKPVRAPWPLLARAVVAMMWQCEMSVFSDNVGQVAPSPAWGRESGEYLVISSSLDWERRARARARLPCDYQRRINRSLGLLSYVRLSLITRLWKNLQRRARARRPQSYHFVRQFLPRALCIRLSHVIPPSLSLSLSLSVSVSVSLCLSTSYSLLLKPLRGASSRRKV